MDKSFKGCGEKIIIPLENNIINAKEFQDLIFDIEEVIGMDTSNDRVSK